MVYSTKCTAYLKASSVPHRDGCQRRVLFTSIVRVYKTPSQKSCNKESLVIVKTPESTPVSFGEKRGKCDIKQPSYPSGSEPGDWWYPFFRFVRQHLLTDKDYGTQFTPFNIDAGVPSFNVRHTFLLDKDEVIYGLGQQQTGKVNQRN